MANVIIFGTQDTASLAHYYLKNDSAHRVTAFCVTQNYLDKDTFEGLPIVPFEEIEKHFSPESYSFFAPMMANRMNKLREEIYLTAKKKGYKIISYLSSKATIFPNSSIGENCFILENNTIQPYCQIGNNVVLWSGNHIGHHSIIEDHCFFTSHIVLSGHCYVEKYCYIGVNASIRDQLRLAEGSLIGMGTCIERNTEAYGVYKGNPGIKKNIRSDQLKGFS